MDPENTTPTDEAQLTDEQLEDVSGGTWGVTIVAFFEGL